MPRLLIVEDEPALRRALAINLRARQYDVDTARDAESALRMASESVPDLAIVDLGLPDLDGLQVIRGLRGWTQLPIIVLSARDSQSDKVAALDAGADDYVTKPFGMAEFLARIRAALRRADVSDPSAEAIVRTESFTLDLATKRAWKGTEEVRLTPTEWHLVDALVKRPGILVPSTQLLAEVWGPKYRTETNYLRVYFAQLRRKLEADPPHPRHFVTEPGLGYRFEFGAEPTADDAR